MAGKATNGIADFDFLIGSWAIENERLTTRLAGSADWERFLRIFDLPQTARRDRKSGGDGHPGSIIPRLGAAHLRSR